jgi:hypothetical protein
MQQETKTNIWFFVGKSIGVTLLGLYVLEQAQLKLGRENCRLFLLYTHASKPSEEMLKAYPHIRIVYFDWSHLKNILVLFFGSFNKKNIFVYPPSFGRAPILVRFFSRMLTLFNTKSRCVAALPNNEMGDALFFTKVSPLDLHKNIFFSTLDLLSAVSTEKVQPPALIFSYDASLRKKLPREYIVFHPFAANEGRTYPDSLSKKLLAYLIETYPHYKIILSGSSKDLARAKKIIDSVPRGHTFIEPIQTYIGEHFSGTSQVLSDATLYIGVDTGITHLAAHVHVPSVILGNQSNPMWLPTYAPSVTVLFNEQHCTCTFDKKGFCHQEVDGKIYYRCMVEISWQSLCSAIELRLHG